MSIISDLKRFILSDIELIGNSELGRGAYGVVEKVKRKNSGTICAAKTVHKHLLGSVYHKCSGSDMNYVTKTFFRECDIISKVNDRHIVQFLGICYLRGSSMPSLVMELLETSLHDMLEKSPNKIPLSTKHSILLDIAQGLHYLHERSQPIIHRDLTATNVLITSAMTAKIADLGVARIVDLQPGELVATMTMIPGNALYMPPEVFLAVANNQAQYGTPVDIFSFGNIILFTLTQNFRTFCNVKPAKCCNHETGKLILLTEIERREESLRQVQCELGNTRLIKDCLQDFPKKRPTALEVKERIEKEGLIGNIAAIDFGTSTCSLAYNLSGTPERIQSAKLDGVNHHCHASILIDDHGSVIKFGSPAEDEWVNICDNPQDMDKFFFFKQTKIALLQKQSISSINTIKAANGKECFLIEVIAIILRHIKHVLIEKEMKSITHRVTCTSSLDATDFNWVITVPAIWNHGAKQMMREAAYMAGIATSEESVIRNLTEVKRDHNNQLISSPQSVERRSIKFPGLLTLAHEPEATALHCMKTLCIQPYELSNSYIVVDIGGGTLDILAITHDIDDDTKLRVVVPPRGNDFGGGKVNEAMWKFLGELVNDPNFEKIKQDRESAEDILALERNIESTKCEFGSSKEECIYKDFVLKLPGNFKTTYCEAIQENVRRHTDVQFEGRRLIVSFNKMEEFFKPTVDSIATCIDEYLRNSRIRGDAVFLVGDFGCSSYVYRKLKPVAETHSCQLYKSPDHMMSVVTGAVHYRKNPQIFNSRVSDATYGVAYQTDFDSKRHSKKYRIHDRNGVAKCKNLFKVLVAKGEVIPHKITHEIIPKLQEDQKSISFDNLDILVTDNEIPMYAYTPDDQLMPGIRKVGHVQFLNPIEFEAGTELGKVNLMFQFNGTELHVQLEQVEYERKVSTVVNFLNGL